MSYFPGVPPHNQAATTITTGTLDGDRLPALSATKKGGAPATGTPSGLFLRDDGTWQVAGGGSTPTGTGWRHVTAGVEDAAASTPTAGDTGAEPANANIQTHVTGTGSPHTAAGVGAEAAGAVAAHAGAADPHSVYQKESERAAANGYASLDAGALVPVAQLATGTPDGTKFLRDDRTWQAVAGGSVGFALAPAANTTIPAGNGLELPLGFEIVDTYTFEIGNLAVLGIA